jgi:hypothetical protein
MFHFEKTLDKPYIGFSLDNVRTSKDGQEIRVMRRGFFTDYQGEHFYSILNSVTNIFLREWMSMNRLDESIIRNCLIFLNDNNIADIYINIPSIMKIIARGRIKYGSEITKNDVADIVKIEFPGVELKQECKLVYIFNFGWRRGLYFDLIPVQDQVEPVKGDLGTLFASLHSYLIFQEVFDLTPEIKETLMRHGWFPFIRILGNNFEKIRDAVVYDFPIMEISLEVIETFNKDSIIEIVNNWMKKDIFKTHEVLIRKGIEKYLEGDFISAIHILYPRIEGIMRYVYLGEKDKPKSHDLRKELVFLAKEKCNDSSLYLPDDFDNYLKDFYFSSFSLKEGKLGLSRNSLAHGVAKEEDFNKINAFQSIMILDQISFYV